MRAANDALDVTNDRLANEIAEAGSDAGKQSQAGARRKPPKPPTT